MATMLASAPAAATEHPLRNPQYRKLLIGSTISFVGDQFYLVALPWLVLQQTGSAVAKIGRAHVELQSLAYLVCRLLLEKKKPAKSCSWHRN